MTVSKARAAAIGVLRDAGCQKPGKVTIEELINCHGGFVREQNLRGCEGRTVLNGDGAIVTINSAITFPGKRNFVLAHELGHLILHRNIMPFFSDTITTLSQWYRNGPQEVEANAFATELLMPPGIFREKVRGKKLSLALIEDLAEYFQVSLTAAFLRYLDVGDFPVMVVFITNGFIEWHQSSDDFPFKYLPLKVRVPALTVAGDFFYHKTGLPATPEKVDVIEWFPEDREAQKRVSWQIYEQCYRVAGNSLVSCLWTFQPSTDKLVDESHS